MKPGRTSVLDDFCTKGKLLLRIGIRNRLVLYRKKKQTLPKWINTKDLNTLPSNHESPLILTFWKKRHRCHRGSDGNAVPSHHPKCFILRLRDGPATPRTWWLCNNNNDRLSGSFYRHLRRNVSWDHLQGLVTVIEYPGEVWMNTHTKKRRKIRERSITCLHFSTWKL